MNSNIAAVPPPFKHSQFLIFPYFFPYVVAWQPRKLAIHKRGACHAICHNLPRGLGAGTSIVKGSMSAFSRRDFGL